MPQLTDDSQNGWALCTEKSLMAAAIYAERYDVRIMRGSTNQDWDHVQAQAYINGEWVWLQTSEFEVWIGEKENFDPYAEYTMDQVWQKVKTTEW